MQVGTENISPTQHAYLQRAKHRGPSQSDLARHLMSVVNDPDILQGREDVHPDWLEIFKENKEKLAADVPPPIFAEMSTFFDNLSPFDHQIGDLDPQSLNIAFLLGAGASKPT